MQQTSPQDDKPILSVKSAYKRYGSFVALDHVSLELARGKHMLVLGPNGAGKSTLIKSIMDLINFQGEITVVGVNVKKHPREAKRLIGYVPQNYSFYETLTVLEHAKLTTRLKQLKTDEMQEKLELVDLWRVRNRKVGALSDGMKQRLGIALALIGNPPLLLLDEPTSNVDLRGQVEFQNLLQGLLDQGKTMITTTHLTGLGELADYVMVLDKGKVIAKGTPRELLGKTNAMDTLYVRVESDRKEALLAAIAKYNAVDMEAKGAWVTASIPGTAKMDLLRTLLNGDFGIEDFMIERSKIESEYLKLIAPSSGAAVSKEQREMELGEVAK